MGVFTLLFFALQPESADMGQPWVFHCSTEVAWESDSNTPIHFGLPHGFNSSPEWWAVCCHTPRAAQEGDCVLRIHNLPPRSPTILGKE